MINDSLTIHVLHTESIYSRGGEKYLYEILRRVSNKHTVHVYLHAISPEWKRLYRAAKVKTHSLWKPKRFFWLLLPVTVFINYIQVKRVIRNNDVVFSTSFPMNLLAVLVSNHAVCHCAEPLPIFYDKVRIASLPRFSRFCVKAAKAAYASFDRWAYRSCAVLTTLNKAVRKHVYRTYQRKSDMFLPNGIDSNRFSPARSFHKRKTWIIGHSTDYTVFKGTQSFLAIMSALRKHRIPFVATISESIADPKVKQNYIDYIHQSGLDGCIRFIGTLSESKLVEFYRDLDLFVFTGSPEGSGAAAASMSVLEAQSCEVPAIRSYGDDGELLDGKTGFYIDPSDSHGSAKIIARYLLLSQNKKTTIRKRARGYVTDNFNWDMTAEGFLRALHTAQRTKDEVI